jgi:hypothetical protein
MGLLDLFGRRPTARSVTHATVIPVANVSLANSPFPEVSSLVAVQALLQKPPPRFRRDTSERAAPPSRPPEACSCHHGTLVANVFFHPVIAAIHQAYCDHRPVVLSPDMLWLLVLQGFANHVNANAEELRPKFVQHPGRVTIKVRRDDFVKGSPTNPWPEVFGEFSRHIRDHVGAATHDLLLPNFSTTSAVERAAAEVVLLDAMQSYFEYELVSMCGIPEIVLEGTMEDWTRLAERTRGLGQFGLEWWTEILAPVLEQFVAAARGQVNRDFWQSIYKVDAGSGGPYINGWITAFFPYLKEYSGPALWRNRYLTEGGPALQKVLYPWAGEDPRESREGVTTDQFPGGLARAPFRWNSLGDVFAMEFLGGFVGVRQDPQTLGLRPEIGWAIREQEVAERAESGLDDGTA